MTQVLLSIAGFILAISILVFVHEWGHFWVARRFGIKVLRFSIGFGRPFLRWHDKLGTEYVLAMLPLGGYVSLFGERDTVIPESQKHMAFSYKPVGVRIMVLLAGPIANLLFAILAYWCMFMMGISSLAPVLGHVPQGSIAERAGLHTKQEIVSIENKPIRNWEEVSVALMSHLGNEHLLTIKTKEPNGDLTTHTLELSSLPQTATDGDLLKEIGLEPLDPYPPIIKRVLPGSPADNAGLMAQDRIVSINGQAMSSRLDVNDFVQPKPGETLLIEVARQQSTMRLHVQPQSKTLPDGKVVGFLGIEYEMKTPMNKDLIRVEKYGPGGALVQAIKRTYDYTLLTLDILKKMVTGSVSAKHLSGPIAIAQFAGQSVSYGLEYFLSFLAVISISLGVLNLLPIPLLDGGHLVYCLFELVTGRPLSQQIQNVGYWLGGILLIAVMILAFYNDLMRF